MVWEKSLRILYLYALRIVAEALCDFCLSYYDPPEPNTSCKHAAFVHKHILRSMTERLETTGKPISIRVAAQAGLKNTKSFGTNPTEYDVTDIWRRKGLSFCCLLLWLKSMHLKT